MSSSSSSGNTSEEMQSCAYGALVDIFHKYESRTIQIEILPPAISPPEGSLLLEDEEEGSVGIPKAILLNAFLAARKVFFERRHALTGPSAQKALDATRVMLLFDPEHLTAANYRKRYLLVAQKDGNAEILKLLVRRDLIFLFTLFSSPLFRHTKSPTLWSHCLWIARNYWDIEVDWAQNVVEDAHDGDSRDNEKTPSHWLISLHWEKVKDATKSHPKNYHAWHFMRKFVQLLSERQTARLECGFESEFVKLLQETHCWCLRNPSDTSGWAFLSFMFWRREARGHEDLICAIIDNVLTLVYDFRWRHESIWTFIRTVLAAKNLMSEDLRAKLIRNLEEKYRNDGSANRNAPEDGILAPHPAIVALKWIRDNS